MDSGTSGRKSDLTSLRISEDQRGNAGSRSRRPYGIGGAIVVILALVVIFARGGRAPEVRVATARSVAGSGLATLLNASGYVEPRRRATVAAKITARVVEMLADEGMRVEAGQVLARLDDSDAQRRLAVARATRDVAAAAVQDLEVNLANAERELARQRDLQSQGVASEQALDNARTAADSLRARLAVTRQQVVEAQAAVAIAEQDVDNCTVRAPFAGIVVSKDAQPGEMVSPVSAGSGFTRTGIATVVDMASLEVEVDVNESYIARVEPGQRVEATLDAYPDWKIPASVRTVIPTADRQKATVKVRISFDQLDPRILPDMGVKVAFLAQAGAQSPAGAARTLVPQAALREADGRTVVLVVRDDRLERRAVTVGGTTSGDTEVLAGLAEGEAVVVAGPAVLRDGQRVRIRE
jgi:RND family efflux transporter MFP subunit